MPFCTKCGMQINGSTHLCEPSDGRERATQDKDPPDYGPRNLTATYPTRGDSLTAKTASNPGVLLRSYEALYNWRALAMLAGSFMLGGLAISRGAAAGDSLGSPGAMLLMMILIVIGMNASGLMLTDQAYDRPVRGFGPALLGGIRSALYVIGQLILLGLGFAMVVLAAFLLSQLGRFPGVGGLFGFLLAGPLVVVVALACAVLLLAGPLMIVAVWHGEGFIDALSRVVGIVIKRPLEVFMYFLLLVLLVSPAAAFTFVTVFVGSMLVGGFFASGAFGSLGGLGGLGGLESLVALESLIGLGDLGGGLVPAALSIGLVRFLALSVVILIYELGLIFVYRAVSEVLSSSPSRPSAPPKMTRTVGSAPLAAVTSLIGLVLIAGVLVVAVLRNENSFAVSTDFAATGRLALGSHAVPKNASSARLAQAAQTLPSVSSIPQVDCAVPDDRYWAIEQVQLPCAASRTISYNPSLLFLYQALSGTIDYNFDASVISCDYSLAQDEFKRQDLMSELKPRIDSEVSGMSKRRYFSFVALVTIDQYDFAQRAFPIHGLNQFFNFWIAHRPGKNFFPNKNVRVRATNADNFSSYRVSDEATARQLNRKIVQMPRKEAKLYVFALSLDDQPDTIDAQIVKAVFYTADPLGHKLSDLWTISACPAK